MRNPQKNRKILNVIIADTDWSTFELLTGLNDECNILNLSSEFAISFIMECEHIDVIVASKKIANIENIKKLAERKKISVYIIGTDTQSPLERNEFCEILERERGLRFTECKVQAVNIEKNPLKRVFDRKGGALKSCAKTEVLQDDKEVEKDAYLKVMQDDGKGKEKTAQHEEKPELQEDYILKNGMNNYRDKSGQNDNALPLNNFVAIKQKIIVFLKAKGGVGSTLLSLYLASKFSNLKTLLVDLNFSEGGSDTGYYLELPKTPNMILFTDGYSRTSLNNSVINIKNGFDVLQPPPTYELSKKMDLQDIYSIVDIARKKYHLLIFDLPNLIDEICLGMLDLADLAVMVSDLSSGSIARLTDINKRFIYSDLEKILILNRSRNGNGKHIVKKGLKDFFGINDVVSFEENVLLSGRFEFSRFDFGSLREFEPLTGKVLERLTCEQ